MPETPTTPAATPAPQATTPLPAAPKVDAKPVDAKPADPASVAPKADEKPADPKAQTDAQRFASLGRKEAALREKDKAVKAREAAADAKVKEWEGRFADAQKQIADLAPLLKARELAATDPWAAAKMFGLDYDKLTEAALAQKDLPPEEIAKRAARAEIDAERKRLADEAEKARAEREKAAAAEKERLTAEGRAALERFRAGVIDFVKANSGTYELTATQGAATLVHELIEAHYEKTGKVLSNEEAAQLVEAHLEEEALRLAATPKVSAKIKPPTPPPEAPKPETEAPPRRTLTNDLTATTPRAPSGRLSEQDRMRLAAEAFERARKR
jgi:hypothetical protein